MVNAEVSMPVTPDSDGAPGCRYDGSTWLGVRFRSPPVSTPAGPSPALPSVALPSPPGGLPPSDCRPFTLNAQLEEMIRKRRKLRDIWTPDYQWLQGHVDRSRWADGSA